jgi:NAD+ kinase
MKTAQAAEKLLREAGAETCFCLPFQLEEDESIPQNLLYRDIEEEIKTADMLVCFGGDGTILHAAKEAVVYDVPILGVNMGSVGFMAELEHGELPLLRKIVEGAYTVESRMMLDVKVFHDKKLIYEDLALNDAVMTKGAISRVVDLSVFSDKSLISRISGDGVVLSTPTGSTAYSMAAGGPIVEPASNSIGITPICAHSLSAKAFVVAPERVVEAKVDRGSHKVAYVSVDGGKPIRCVGGDRVQVTMSEHRAKLVHITKRSFYDIVYKKLGKR